MFGNVLQKAFPPGGSVLLRTVAALVAALFAFTAATAYITYRNTKADALSAQDVELAEVASSLARADVVNRIPGALTMAPETFERALEDEMKSGPQDEPEWHGRGRGHRGMGRHPGAARPSVFLRTSRPRAAACRFPRGATCSFACATRAVRRKLRALTRP